jgi:membrane-bound ClpP family serine protease
MRGQMFTAGALVLVGLIWIGQGAGLLRGSGFMVGEPFWAVLGVVFVVAGAILAVSAWRSPRPDA